MSPEGANEHVMLNGGKMQAALLANSHACHMMKLLSDTDHQALSTDNMLAMSVNGSHHTVSPYPTAIVK